MCGIYGFFDRQRRDLQPATITAMADAISHRGPDGHGNYVGQGVCVGNQRLAILDLAGGNQPFFSDDKQIAVVQNGEIFNFVELTEELRQEGIHCRTTCDTEVILRLYERHGINFVPKLNGMFAIAIHDQREDCVYLIRDRVGEKPLYIHDDGKRVVFSSEIKSLLEAGVACDPDPVALDQFLAFNFIPPPRTMFKDVVHVMPGHWMKITRRGAQVTRWWDLAAIHSEEKSEGEWIEEFNAILDDAVRIRLRADVPFGAFLSGGVDSSTVVGMMARHLPDPVRTFCIGFHEPRFDESLFAAEAAERFQTRHVMRKVDANMLDLWPKAIWHCDQPHGDISFLPTMRVSQLAVEQVKMVLTGDGADELFAGYDKYKNFFADPAIATCPDAEFRRRYYSNLCLFKDDARRRIRGEKADEVGEAAFDSLSGLFNRSAHMDRINQALYVDMMHLLPGNNLVKPDRMSMAVGLETRAPFLDYRMMEFAFRIPGRLKLQNGETKYIYKKAVAPLIGQNLAYRKKQMFTVPVGEWFKTTLAGYCQEMLLSVRTGRRGLFEASEIERMLKLHRTSVQDFTREIRALIAVELWNRVFVDADVKPAALPKAA
jgi:asparagine synthase (glutamine-hydrolysing)